MASDLDTLVDMGFDRERAELAVKQSGGLQGAIDWLETNQEKSIEDIKAESAAATTAGEESSAAATQESKSLVCGDCQKRFRNAAEANYHASKTGHTDFSESTEEIAPLTAEEKAARLEELRERLAAKRAEQSIQDKADAKRNDEIRRKNTKELEEAKEELKRKEQIKEAEKKKREQREDILAKKRIRDKIAADKEERKRKAEQEKLARAGELPQQTAPAVVPTPADAVNAAKPAGAYAEARLRLQTSAGSIQKNFPAETTLFEVAEAIREEKSLEVESFETTFPRKRFPREDWGMTLKEAGLVPSAAVIVK